MAIAGNLFAKMAKNYPHWMEMCRSLANTASPLAATVFRGPLLRFFEAPYVTRPGNIDANARCGQFARSHTLQPVPIGVLLLGSCKSKPREYTRR